MAVYKKLEERCHSICELCAASTELNAYIVPPRTEDEAEYSVAVCSTCLAQITEEQPMDVNHWHGLNESAWSEHPPVQVVSYRILKRLSTEGWAQDLLGMMYLDDETKAWAENANSGKDEAIIHKDSNGAILETGDSVVLIKDLNVKGANFTAKRGTAVRRIRVDLDNPTQIEGKVNGQNIVILTQFVKKTT